MPTRYRLDVLAASVEDVVRSAGGWLFDRAMAGWEVNLLVTEPCDTRRLRILGINTVALQPTFASTPDFPRVHAIAVAADVLAADKRLRQKVIVALDRGVTEVTLWGDDWPPAVHRRAGEVVHRLSTAARAFKSHALAGTRPPAEPANDTERFRSGSRWYPPYEPDLLPVG
ncbi:MAG: hypothetical protein JO191_10650 [Mycobacteriaceae bacterium]|nr:hypothetical protein [Mycobacteriaceae bacterium]